MSARKLQIAWPMERVDVKSPYEYVSNYDANRAWLKISNEQIRDALPFEGHGPIFLEWPDRLWTDKRQGIPCEDRDKNAYHILWLAQQMKALGRWIGGPLRIREHSDRLVDGSHRLRAAQYLKETEGITFEIPIQLEDDQESAGLKTA